MIAVGHDEEIRQWVSLKLGIEIGQPGSVGLGFIVDDQLVAGAVFHNYHIDQNGYPLSIEVSMYADSPRWATRGNIDAIFRYAFLDAGVKRLQAVVEKRNRRVRKLLEGTGFKMEGVHRCASHTGRDMCSYSKLRREYGQESRHSRAA